MLLALLLTACWSPGPSQAATPNTTTGWVPPNAATSAAAIGDPPKDLARWLDPKDFGTLGTQGPGDWLAEHHEAGQTFRAYQQAPGRQPTPTARTIVLQPIGHPGVSTPAVSAFTEAWFGLPVRLEEGAPIQSTGATARMNPSEGHPQWLTTDLLTWLEGRVAPDTFALVGIAGPDLYPHPDWNFVFGQATYHQGVGVWSVARLGRDYGASRGRPAGSPRLLRRVFKLMAHEVGHMYGMQHCTHFSCVMNGSNSLAETDQAPLHLGPVCLRKLLHSSGQDPAERYRKLEALYREFRLVEEADWVAGRLAG